MYLQLNYSLFAGLGGHNNLPAIVNNISSAYKIVKCYRGKKNYLFIIHCTKRNYIEWLQLFYILYQYDIYNKLI